MNRPLRKTALRAIALLRERHDRELGELIELAASEDGINPALGWRLNLDTGEWTRPAEPET